MTDPPLRVAIWCAVSSKPQAADDKNSLQAQENAGRQFAQAIGGVVVSTYIIRGATRDLIFWEDAERSDDAYRQLREDVAAGAFDILHAIDPDRLGRDPALSNQVLSLVEKSGAEVYFATAPHVIGSKGTGERYVFAIQSTRAGEDQRRRVQHHATGMRNRTHHRGLHPGIWPYGYKPIRDPASGLVVGAELDPAKIPALQLITKQGLQGAPYQHIADALQAAGHPSPRGLAHWSHTTVSDILHNPIYAGYVQWQNQPAPEKSDKFPALWDDATYAAIQRELEHRHKSNGRRTNSAFLDIAHCGRCGGKMHIAYTGKGHTRGPAYGCANHHKRRIQCHANTTLESLLITATTQYLQRLTKPAALEAALAARLTPEDQLRQDLASVDARIAAIDQKRQRLALALAAGDMEPAIYKSADATIAADLSPLNQKRAQLLDALQTISDIESQRQTIHTLLEQLPTLWTLPGAQINALLRHAGIRIECTDRQITKITLA